ncbi:MAG: VOC family protein [Geodermatophilaceae bacterium]
MAIEHTFAGVPVADYASARAWYERLFGRPPDLIPHDTEAAWQLGGTSWVYVVEDAGRAGNALLTLMVDDLDEHVRQLAERGLRAGTVERVEGKYAKASITDPEGNLISFGENLGDDA